MDIFKGLLYCRKYGCDAAKNTLRKLADTCDQKPGTTCKYNVEDLAKGERPMNLTARPSDLLSFQTLSDIDRLQRLPDKSNR